MSYDDEALKAYADPKVVADYIGMETRKRGIHTFIRCPSHEQTIGRADKSIGNCILTKNGFKCFACHAYGDVFDMVMAHTGCSYPEALKTVGDACGGANAFLNNEPFHRKPTILSSSDLALIGLVNAVTPEQSDEGRLLYNISSEKASETERTGCARKGDEYVLYVKGEKTTLQNLQEKDPKAYCALIVQKAKEAMKKYLSALKDCDNSRSKRYQDIIILFGENGKVDDGVFEGIKKALREKRKRAESIHEEYSKRLEQLS